MTLLRKQKDVSAVLSIIIIHGIVKLLKKLNKFELQSVTSVDCYCQEKTIKTSNNGVPKKNKRQKNHLEKNRTAQEIAEARSNPKTKGQMLKREYVH